MILARRHFLGIAGAAAASALLPPRLGAQEARPLRIAATTFA